MNNINPKTKNFIEDFIVPFTLQSNSIRGRSVRLSKSIRMILSRHKYPEEVSRMLAEALILNCLIGQTIKLRWKLSLQVRGTGAIKLISTDYKSPLKTNSTAKIRGFASFDQYGITNSKFSGIRNLGKGFFAIIIDQGRGSKPYQGITPFEGQSLSDCAEHYFLQSEQLPTFFKIIIRDDCYLDPGSNFLAGGVMIQYLPKDQSVNQSENWNKSKIFLSTIGHRELFDCRLPQEELLERVFHQQDLKFMKCQRVEFGCSCNLEKVTSTLSTYSRKELETMVNEVGEVTADCQFCGQQYRFTPTPKY